jgi:phosphohistidine swiveling domain-containing protein
VPRKVLEREDWADLPADGDLGKVSRPRLLEAGPPGRWRGLAEFRWPAIPKLNNLRRAAEAGFRVPETVWAWAVECEREEGVGEGDCAREGVPATPCIVRSGSPIEDTNVTSNAGQLVSVAVQKPEQFPDALKQVIAALPRAEGRPQGVVFVQPLVVARTAGVTFFDGFYFEETSTAGSNQALTAGARRGAVCRGTLQRGEPRSEWLLRLHAVFGGRLDIEWAHPSRWDSGEPVLLQVRPALFPLRRNYTLSLANHMEILGDPPSPWMVGVLTSLGHPILEAFGGAEPILRTWDEPYAVELAERAWLNLSVYLRLMDHWGLPRTLVTEVLGGDVPSSVPDRKLLIGRFLRSLPAMARMAWAAYATIARIGRGLRAVDTELAAARSLRDLYQVNVRAFAFSIQTNFALMIVLAVAARLRRSLGMGRAARLVTEDMMDQFAAIAARPDRADRLAGLDAWLARYGHRGPLESDPWRPRFAELRATLRADLMPGPAPTPRSRPQPNRWIEPFIRLLFLADEWRESFRDRLMKRWQTLRKRVLQEARNAVAAGWLDQLDDVFFLRGNDLEADPSTWRDRVHARRARWQWAKGLRLPTTSTADDLMARIVHAEAPDRLDGLDRAEFRGIGLGRARVTGTAVRARDLSALLRDVPLPPSPILVVPSLEPSWAVVFPRFAAVVAELGGELSHASILLREAGIPSVVNARGIFSAVVSGDQLVVDPERGLVALAHRSAS